MEPGAAPAAAARNRGTGRPRVAVRPYYGGLPLMAGRGTDEGRRKLPGSGRGIPPVRARKHGPGDWNRRSGAPRGAPPSPRRRRASPGVSGGFASRPGGLASLRVSRRSAPSRGRRMEDGVPGAAKNTGGGVLAIWNLNRMNSGDATHSSSCSGLTRASMMRRRE